MVTLRYGTLPEQGWGGLKGRGRDLNLGGGANSEAGPAPERLATRPARSKAGQQSRDPPPGRRVCGLGTGG